MANSLNTITVGGITYDAAEYEASQALKTAKANDDLGKEAFLQLLVAQMKYQDPLDPQDNSEYVAELANFSALEQMTNVNKNIESLATVVNNIDTSVLVGQLSSMIGKEVNWTVSNTHIGADGKSTLTTTKMSGFVKGVSINDGVPTVLAESDGVDYKIAISDITKVNNVESNGITSSDLATITNRLDTLSSIVNNIDSSMLVGQLSNMIGKDINWLENSDDNTNSTFTGMVQGVSVVGGLPIVVANSGGQEYNVSIANILSVGNVNIDSILNMINSANASTTV